MDPLKLFNAILFLFVALGALTLMVKVREKRDFRAMVKAFSCWSLGMAALTMTLHPYAAELSSIYLWWKASVAGFVLFITYDRLWPRRLS